MESEAKREELKARRKRLFERFVKNPENIRLAIEIKRMDDQVAGYTNQLVQDSKFLT
jgi:hypothetical protein